MIHVIDLQGSQCCSLQWGPWAEVGMAASDPTILKTLARQGYGAVTPVAGLSALQSLMSASSVSLNSSVMISLFNWPVFLRGTHKFHETSGRVRTHLNAAPT